MAIDKATLPKILDSKDFPAIRVGRMYQVCKQDLDRWMEVHANDPEIKRSRTLDRSRDRGHDFCIER